MFTEKAKRTIAGGCDSFVSFVDGSRSRFLVVGAINGAGVLIEVQIGCLVKIPSDPEIDILLTLN